MTARTTTDATAAASGSTDRPQKTSSSSRDPEFVAVVLASSVGSRLFPLTSSSSNTTSFQPKHLLPVGGIPVLHRLLDAIVCQPVHFTNCVVAISAQDDNTTIDSLREYFGTTTTATASSETSPAADDTSDPVVPNLGGVGDDTDLTAAAGESINRSVFVVSDTNCSCKVTVVRLPENCSGSGQALRMLQEMNNHQCHHGSSSSSSFFPEQAHTVVFPADLIVLDPQPLQAVVHAHRQHQPQSKGCPTTTACTVLLAAVGEQDEHGVPLKESAKQKKGGLARQEEEIEYVALSYETSSSSSLSSSMQVAVPRLVWKQAKLDVEQDHEGTGATPKLLLPKPRLRLAPGCITKVRTDWNDVHVYVLSPWVRRLVQARESILSLREDLLPLLIARQFKGVVATFGKGNAAAAAAATATNNSTAALGVDGMDESTRSSTLPQASLSSQPATTLTTSSSSAVAAGGAAAVAAAAAVAGGNTDEYAVRALVQDATILRSHTLPAYLYANREVVRRALAAGGDSQSSSKKQPQQPQQQPALYQVKLPPGCNARAKFQSILLSDTVLADNKVNFKSAVVGQGCKIGTKCRLNNVVLLNEVTVGDNTILQNTVVAAHASIGDSCSLNDCQVGPGMTVPNATKEKGESFVVENDDDGHNF